MAEGLELVSVFLTELLGSLGSFWHVGLARHRSLYHLLMTKTTNMLTAAAINESIKEIELSNFRDIQGCIDWMVLYLYIVHRCDSELKHSQQQL